MQAEKWIKLTGNLAPNGVYIRSETLPEGMHILRGLLRDLGTFPAAARALAAGEVQKGSLLFLPQGGTEEEAAEYCAALERSGLSGQLCTFLPEEYADQITVGAVVKYSPEVRTDILREGDIVYYDIHSGVFFVDVSEEGYPNRIGGDEQPLVVTQLDENTWSLLSRYSRMYLLKGSERALLIDAGFPVPNLKETIAELAGGLPCTLTLTHGHSDHVGNIDAFDEFWLHPGEREYFYSYRPDLKDSPALRWLAGGQVFDLGGRSLRVIETPGHSPGSVMYYDEANNMLFAGDTLATSPIYLFLPGCSLASLGRSMELLLRTCPRDIRIFPAHGILRLDVHHIENMLALTQQVSAGEVPGVGACISRVPGEPKRYAYRDVSFFY